MINIEELRQAIRGMKPRKRLYRVLKEELGKLGHWKDRPRGNPKKGYEAMREKTGGEY